MRLIHRWFSRSTLPARLLLVAAALTSVGAMAQSTPGFPNRPIRIVLPFTVPVMDIEMRLLGAQWQKTMGQPVIIETRPGGSGSVSALEVARSKPDGHTILYNGGHPFHPIFLKDNGVDALKQLQAVGMVASGPFYYFMRANLPFANWAELLAYSKANPNKLNFGASIVSTDLRNAVLKARTGLTSTSIPYYRDGNVITPLIAGDIDFTAAVLSSYIPLMKEGKVRVLFSSVRSTLMPEIPTAAEVGIENFDFASTRSLWVAAGTPREIVQKLSAELDAAAKTPEFVEFMRKNDQVSVGHTPEDVIRTTQRDLDFYREAMRLTNFQPQ